MSQFLILDAIRGPLAGQSFSVPVGGSLTIGRLPECEVPITQDPTVSRQQCRVEYPGPDARLVHLSQTSDTLVNGAPASRAELRKGDTIELGTGNQFRVRIDDAPAPLAAAKPPANPSSRARAIHYTAAPASSGWSQYQFSDGLESPGQLLELLGKSAPVRAIVDLRRAGADATELAPAWTPIYTWLPPDQQLQFSPVIMSVLGKDAELVKSGWGKDALICVASMLDDAALLAHWQKISGAENGQPGPQLSVFHWPVLLRMILTCQSPAQTAPLLSKLSWIVMEDASAPSKAALFAPAAFADELGKLGFQLSSTSATIVAPEKD